jgi:hypothetical protein
MTKFYITLKNSLGCDLETLIVRSEEEISGAVKQIALNTVFAPGDQIRVSYNVNSDYSLSDLDRELEQFP